MHKNQIVLIFSAVLFPACSLAQELDPGSNPSAKGKNLYTYYIKAAEAGNPFAQLAIAGCYDAGERVSKDQQQALKWYRKAAENDLPYAQYVIAWKYLEGDGVPKNVGASRTRVGEV
jgi:TPR repeat protein